MTHSSFQLMTSGGKLAIYSVVVANSTFANLFVQNAWPAVLYIAFSWHVYYVAIINTFLYFNIIPPTTTVSSQKNIQRCHQPIFLWLLSHACSKSWSTNAYIASSGQLVTNRSWSSVASDAHRALQTSSVTFIFFEVVTQASWETS